MATAAGGKLSTQVVLQTEWLAARKKLLAKEKEFTRLRDELSRERRRLPWEKVEKPYVFESRKGKLSLGDLFGTRSQLIVYHFMFGPGWEEGCPSCSFLADNFDGATVHLGQRDVSFAAVSRATLPEIEAFQKRMGWRFPWVSSFGSDFNFDYGVSFSPQRTADGNESYNYETSESSSQERPGASVFYKDENGEIFHTYSTYARGLDLLLTAYNFLDLTPKGRNEEGMVPHPMAWVRHHDRYASAVSGDWGGATNPGRILDPMLSEFNEEVATTRRVLERVPADKLTWKPHPKSMTLGQLAIHIAMVPGRVAKMTQGEWFDIAQGRSEPPQPENFEEIQATFEESVRGVDTLLKGMTDEAAQERFTFKFRDKELFSKPRTGILRSIMLNHWYHHRGQLSVYLRMLEVPVPTIYGRSGDESPLA